MREYQDIRRPQPLIEVAQYMAFSAVFIKKINNFNKP